MGRGAARAWEGKDRILGERAGKNDIQLRPILVDPCNQQRNAKRPTHNALLPFRSFAKPKREVADGLRAALNAQRFIIVKGVRLRLNTGVLNHGAGVGLEPGHGAADVPVYLDDLLDRRSF